ncbi:MAG: GGDEF domain-containing protein [Pseudomonadota bacterium]
MSQTSDKILHDIAKRSRSGSVLYPIVWLVVAIWTGVPFSHPHIFALTMTVFATIGFIHLRLHLEVVRNGTTHREVRTQLTIAILVKAFVWGILAAWLMADPLFRAHAHIPFTTSVVLAIGGTFALSISRAIHFWYPIFVFGPACAVGLLWGDADFRALVALATGGVIYGRIAARTSANDYFNALEGQALARTRAEELEAINRIDTLTGLSNLSDFVEQMSAAWEDCARLNAPVGLAWIDIDRLKPMNHIYGREFADHAIREFGALIRAVTVEKSTCIARYGGGSFVVILKDSSADQAKELAETILRRVVSLELWHQDQPVRITCSIGLVCTIPYPDRVSETLIKGAAQAQRMASSRGGNQIYIGEYDPDALQAVA